jgi:hypothetical protein
MSAETDRPGGAPTLACPPVTPHAVAVRAAAVEMLHHRRADRGLRESCSRYPESAWETFHETEASCARVAAILAHRRVDISLIHKWGDVTHLMGDLATRARHRGDAAERKL